jgi:formyltetrahydrofolate deformylase
MKKTAILLIHCPDQTGLVAAVTDFLHRNNGNVISWTSMLTGRRGAFLCG